MFAREETMNAQRFSPVLTYLFPMFLVLLACFSFEVRAEPKKLEDFKDWSVYKKDTDAGRVCFMSSVPKKLRGDYNRANRGDTRIFISHGPGKSERDVVSVIAGYRYLNQSTVTFEIDKRKTPLFTLENRAWSQGPEDDQKLIVAMKRGAKLIITGTSSRNNKTVDEYSLSGFTKAKAFLDRACP